mmetsp:Transcript_48470/g.155597  ORF Transcript_48470/g.155597 Transcript_48470/m.155597 type:complete len:108 (-) Transcript_48470:485-808(-)
MLRKELPLEFIQVCFGAFIEHQSCVWWLLAMPQYWVNDYPMPWLPGVFLLSSYHQVRIPSCHCKDRFVGRSLSSSCESETTLRRPDGPCVGFSRRVGVRLPGGALRC